MGVAELAELLWDEPPRSATANIRTHLAGLRRDLDRAEPGLSGMLRTIRGTQCGYGLRAGPDDVDLPKFTAAARRGRTQLLHGELCEAIDSFEEAIAMWHGPFGQDLPATRWFCAHVAGLNNVRVDAYQGLFTACILADRIELLSYRIESAIAEAPYRQRLWELLAAVHCINGDAVSALEVIKRCQVLLAEDLGLDLPPSIEAMRSAALTWDRDEALRLVTAQALGTYDGSNPQPGGQHSSP
ncbi:hypothetical protein SSP24_55990 [Streptomyces spinoverrucosus]|uniref:Bacterial transcriptional activator domain-containing protein n=1 Tax=Streptomyces spinoverrucosus TaxID=284043 RepID=A0A4Y3VM00_9ACTN|nr:hypothetical protein SSP24_55990 [Streptomyces spinoverrucosus]GHB85848.1 hypothetical protein GCM10010397_66550 [Streptomyces spinoverrucosus]